MTPPAKRPPHDSAKVRPTRARAPATAAPSPGQPERIAKVIARAGIASRRDAEAMVTAGRVAVNGSVIDSPARNVTATDRITVDGKPLSAPEAARLWLYHKPAGLVTSARDEKGRPTVFDALPPDMPRVMSIGRLDLTSEGLLLLTNDGALKRRLELPATGWLRRYRVRIKGAVSEAALDRLRDGITVEGVSYQPMTVTFDRQQGANAWLTIGLREGKNREIRRALTALGVTVNRLIRVSYGPFQLGNLVSGGVEEVRGKILRDQLGETQPRDDATGNPARSGTARRNTPAATAGAKAPREVPPGKTTGGRDARARTGAEAKGPEAKSSAGRGKDGTRAAPLPRGRDSGGKPGSRTGGRPGGKPPSR